jgi:hypothetical protein
MDDEWTDGTDDFSWMMIGWLYFGACLFGMVMFIPEWIWAAAFGVLALMFLPGAYRGYILWVRSKKSVQRLFTLTSYRPDQTGGLFEDILTEPWRLKLVNRWGSFRGKRFDQVYETTDGSPVTITVYPDESGLQVVFKLSPGAFGLKDQVEMFAAQKGHEP